MIYITIWRYVLKTFIFTFFFSVLSSLPANALVMTFSGGTGYYYEYCDETGEDVLMPDPGPYWTYESYYTGQFVAYEENGLYLELGTTYEWDIVSFLYIEPPFEYLNFSLTSGGRFNLDSLDLILALDRPDYWLHTPDDLVPESVKDVQFLLTASNTAGYIFPTSSAYQNAHLNFGNLFHDIDFFTITVSGTFLEDQTFIIDNVTVTPIPTPGSGLLFALGLLALFYHRPRLSTSQKAATTTGQAS